MKTHRNMPPRHRARKEPLRPRLRAAPATAWLRGAGVKAVRWLVRSLARAAVRGMLRVLWSVIRPDVVAAAQWLADALGQWLG